MKKTLALVLALLMVVSVFAGCKPADSGNTNPSSSTNTPATGDSGTEGPSYTVTEVEGNFIYKDAVSLLATNWNPHTYQSADDSYPLDYTTSSLYTFLYNDALHPVEGKEEYEGYVIVPELAAGMPVDVTEQMKADHPEYNIPADATQGYAYTIDLNPNAVFSNGEKITAQTYVDSLQRLLDPRYLNYRAEDIYNGGFVIFGTEDYANQGRGNKYAALGMTVQAWLDAGNSEDDLYINIGDFWGIKTADGSKWASVKDTTKIRDEAVPEGEDGDWISPAEVYAYMAPGGPYHDGYSMDYCGYISKQYPDTYDFADVALKATGEYQITFVLAKSLSGFQLIYQGSVLGSMLVEPKLYDSLLTEKEGVWTSTYNTSVKTSVSYGPYKMSAYQTDKFMHFVRNESWFGYGADKDKYVYKDPEDGNYYRMYQTSEIDTQVVAEATTQKQMFLAGQLMGYGLQAEDYETYRNSEFLYETPATTIFFLVLNGHLDAIQEREAAADFDKNTDIETITLNSFRRAMAITYDKDLFCSTVSPARSATFAAIGNLYIYDVDTGARYRDTDQAKQILCDIYSVDTSKYANLDEAVDSITGYNPEKARELYQQAYEEALAAGYITDANNDGVSDQTVTITYSLSSDSDFMTLTINTLNSMLDEVLQGTGFAGKVKIVKSAPQPGDEWSESLKAGQTDCCLCGWQGSALDPFGLTDLYTNPAKQYDAAWFNSTTVIMTLKVPVNGTETEVTMNMKQWSDALNGTAVEVDGKTYNFGDGQADIDTRLTILAAIEGEILKTYNYLPMMQNASSALLTQQVYYVVEEYNPIMGRGGIAYMKYNFTEEEWTAYVAEQGGTLQY